MGIPGFASRMQGYGSRRTLQLEGSQDLNIAAYIDGPALAHYIARTEQRESFDVSILIPAIDYERLGATTVAWLQRLEMYGYHIDGIFFDGALPHHKVETRIKRLQSYVNKLNNYKKLQDASHGHSRIKGAKRGLYSARRQLAPMPFLVSAIVEILLESDFCERVHVVPGEADTYCAAAARQKALIAPSQKVSIFTDDSDLLIFNVGYQTKVVYISSMEYRPLQSDETTSSSIEMTEFWPMQIAASANSSWTDLVYPAFHMRDTTMTFIQARDTLLANEDKLAFAAFSQQFDTSTALEQLNELGQCTSRTRQSVILDARVSEIIHAADTRCISVSTRDQTCVSFVPSSGLYESPSKSTVLFFLPALFEDPSKSSAWKIGQVFRSMAVSLLRAHKNIDCRILEYSRSGTNIKPSDLHIVEQEELHEAFRDWAAHIEALNSDAGHWRDDRYRWTRTVLHVLLSDLANLGMQLPNVATILSVLQNNDIRSWSIAHLSAQFQAEFYSLRILKQICSFVHVEIKKDGKVLDPRVDRFLETISKFPPISDFWKRNGQTSTMSLSADTVQGMLYELQ